MGLGKGKAIVAAGTLAAAMNAQAAPTYQLDFSGEINQVVNGPNNDLLGEVVSGSVQFETTADIFLANPDIGIYNFTNVSGSVDVGAESFIVGSHSANVINDAGGFEDVFVNLFNAASGSVQGQNVINAVLDVRGLISAINGDLIEDVIANVNNFNVSQLLQVATDNGGFTDTLYRGTIEDIMFSQVRDQPPVGVFEPSTLQLLGGGGLAIGLAALRRRKEEVKPVEQRDIHTFDAGM